MFIIKSKAKKGGLWDEKNKRIVTELEIADKTVAKSYEERGCIVEEVKKEK